MAADNLERTRRLIAEGLRGEAMNELTRQRAVDTGSLRDTLDVFSNEEGYLVEFNDYGVFVDEGTGSHSTIGPRPFYSNLIVEGEDEGTYEEEANEMVLDALDLDSENLSDELNKAFE